MKKYIFLAFTTFFLFSCNNGYKYSQDPKLSNMNGAMEDSIAEAVNFIPNQMEFNGTSYTFDWNRNLLDEVNAIYKLTSEPLLYNYYLNRNIYRLLLVEKDKDPLIISINKQEENNWIVSKKISLSTFDIDKAIPDSVPEMEKLASRFKNYSRELTTEEVHAFDSIFQQTNVFLLSNDEADKHYDSYYLLETHDKNNYWPVYKSSDDQALQAIAKYIRSLTGF